MGPRPRRDAGDAARLRAHGALYVLELVRDEVVGGRRQATSGTAPTGGTVDACGDQRPTRIHLVPGGVLIF